MHRLPLTQGQEALIDDEDYASVCNYKWQAQFDDTAFVWYAVRTHYNQDGEAIKLWLHREIMQPSDEFDVDHKDHNPLNCQRHNMRLATRSQNAANKRMYSNNTTGFRGVSRKRGYFEAYIRHDNIPYWLGSFDTAEEAARVRDAKAKELFGEFAILNFPEGT